MSAISGPSEKPLRPKEVYSRGLYLLLKELASRYSGLELIVMENGVSDRTDRLRPSYLVSHLYSTLKAVSEGVPVKGYLHWSLMDNYEWLKALNKDLD